MDSLFGNYEGRGTQIGFFNFIFFNIELDRSAKLINLQKEEFLIKLFHDGGPYHISSEAYQTDRMKHLRWKVFRK